MCLTFGFLCVCVCVCVWLPFRYMLKKFHIYSSPFSSKCIDIYFIPARMVINNKAVIFNSKYWVGCGEKETLIQCWWERELGQPLGETTTHAPPRSSQHCSQWPDMETTEVSFTRWLDKEDVLRIRGELQPASFPGPLQMELKNHPGLSLLVPEGKGVAIPSSEECSEPFSHTAFIRVGKCRGIQHTCTAHQSMSNRL